MQDRVGPGFRCRLCEQARAGDVALRDSQEKHGRGQMFGGVDLAVDAQDFLSAGDAEVVDRAETEMGDGGDARRPREAHRAGGQEDR